jgi:hypothetical protein
MIRHQAEGMNTMAVSLNPFLEKKVEAVPVLVIEKDRISGIPAQNRMVETTWNMQPLFTCHQLLVSPFCSFAGLTP